MRILYSILFFISFSVCNAQLTPTFSGGTVTGYVGIGDTLVIPPAMNLEGSAQIVTVTSLSSSFAEQARTDANLKHLVLPGTITDWFVSNIWNTGSGLGGSNIESMTIGEGLVEIPNYKFSYMGNLETLNLPDSLTKIGDYAFYNCSGLTSLTLPDSLTKIGDYAFYNCSGLTSLTLPDSITKIGDYAFQSCYNLRINNLPTSLTTLGRYAFENCGRDGNLDSFGLPIENEVTLPDTMRVVPVDSFHSSCFTKINLHDDIIEIHNRAFYGMPYLTEIIIPASVNYLGTEIFEDCSRLTSVTFEGNLPAYTLDTFSVGDTNTAIPSIYYKNFSETWELHNQAIGLPLIYLGPPTISLSPNDITATAGSTATISVTASDVLGDSLNYQWLKNGVEVDGETSSSIVFQSISGSDAGNYQVVVSNGNGTTISESASVSILSSSISYTQEQYDAALTTGFNLGVQSVSTEPVAEPPAEPAPDELPSGNVPDSLAGLIEVYSGSTFSENDVFTDAIYYPSDTILQYSDGSSITSETYSWDKDTQTLSVYYENGAVSYTVIYEFFETTNKSIYVQNFKVYNVNPDGETELSGEGFGFMYDADGDLNQNTVSDKEEWIGQSYTTATNFDNFLTDKTTITSSQLPDTLPQLRTESISTITQAAYDTIVAERDAALAAQASAEAERDSKLSLEEVKDLRPGSTMIEIHNGQATLSMQVEESDDLGIWTNGGASTLQIPIDAEAGKKFFRFKMAE
jgi:hypothetical protein